jgi:hypothetical protein
MGAEEQMHDLREAITLLAIAALEPSRFTFDLNLIALGMNGEDRSAALLVLIGLLGAAEGEKPHHWGPDAHPFLQRFSAHRKDLEDVRYERAAEVFADALDVHVGLARTLLDAHMNDGKGLSAHQTLRGPVPLADSAGR